MPVDETLVADGIRTRHVIYEDAARSRFCIDVNDSFAALAVDTHLAGDIDGTVEGVVAKLMGVVA